MTIEASVVYRTGKPTSADYDEAIEALQQAKTQLEPDGRGCVVCWDSGHQAFDCHHNPLIVARRRAADESTWRCFHCGEVFTDTTDAQEHFGQDEHSPARCQDEAVRTVASIAAMLGWANVPPRDTLERDINALKARAALAPMAEASTGDSFSMNVRNPEIEQLQRRLADAIKRQLPEGWGLALFLFEYADKPGGSLFYISTAERPSMVRVIKEWLARQVQ